jgi:hypothetical protein
MVPVYWLRTKFGTAERLTTAKEVCVVSEGQIIQPTTTIFCQAESEGRISVLCILNAEIVQAIQM